MRNKPFGMLIALILALTITSSVIAVTAAKDKARKPAKATVSKLPKLLDLGSTKCIPCKMMVPVLDQISKEYKGQLVVEFIDVMKTPSAATKYKISSIPTQIIFNSKGKEVFRHAGYIPKEDLLKAFKAHGIKLKAPAKPKE